jgi:hypothetical protein
MKCQQTTKQTTKNHSLLLIMASPGKQKGSQDTPLLLQGSVVTLRHILGLTFEDIENKTGVPSWPTPGSVRLTCFPTLSRFGEHIPIEKSGLSRIMLPYILRL